MRSWCAKEKSWADAVLGLGSGISDGNSGQASGACGSSPSLRIEQVIDLTNEGWRERL